MPYHVLHAIHTSVLKHDSKPHGFVPHFHIGPLQEPKRKCHCRYLYKDILLWHILAECPRFRPVHEKCVSPRVNKDRNLDVLQVEGPQGCWQDIQQFPGQLLDTQYHILLLWRGLWPEAGWWQDHWAIRYASQQCALQVWLPPGLAR